MKFLVMWEIDIRQLHTSVIHAVMRMPDYATKLFQQGKLEKRYHIVGRHGGAWIYDVDSNEELERLLAMAPVYNYSRYEIHALAEMTSPAEVLRARDGEAAD